MTAELIITVFIICFAFSIMALIGFGSGLISIPLLALFMPPTQAITLILLFQFLNGVIMLGFNYKKVNWGVLKKVAFGTILGNIIGVLFLTTANEDFVRLSIGLLILVYVIRNHYAPDLGKELTKNLPATSVGLTGGLVQGLFGMGGPIYVIFYNEVLKSHFNIRATVMITLLISNIIRIIGSGTGELLSAEIIEYAIWALPFFLLSIIIGQKLHHKVNRDLFRRGTAALLTISAISLIGKVILNHF